MTNRVLVEVQTTASHELRMIWRYDDGRPDVTERRGFCTNRACAEAAAEVIDQFSVGEPVTVMPLGSDSSALMTKVESAIFPA